jgi:hypothetical protein
LLRNTFGMKYLKIWHAGWFYYYFLKYSFEIVLHPIGEGYRGPNTTLCKIMRQLFSDQREYNYQCIYRA